MKLLQQIIAIAESAAKYSRAEAAKDLHDDFGGRLSLEDCKIIIDAIEDNGDIPSDLQSHLAFAYSSRHSTSGRESIEYIMDKLAQDYPVNESAPSANRNLPAEIAKEFGVDAKMADKIAAWMENGEDEEVEDFLYVHFLNSGEMPYGTAKARTGDPHAWIADKMQSMFSESATAAIVAANTSAVKKPKMVCSVCGKPHQPGGYAHPTKCDRCAPIAVDRAKKLRALRAGTLTKEEQTVSEDWGSSDWTAVFDSIEKDLKRGTHVDDAIMMAAEFYYDHMGYDNVTDAAASIKRLAKVRKYKWIEDSVESFE